MTKKNLKTLRSVGPSGLPRAALDNFRRCRWGALFGFLLTVLSIWDTGLYLYEHAPWEWILGQSRSLCLKSRFVLWRRRRVCLTNEPRRRLSSSSKSTFVLLASCIKNNSDELWWTTEVASSSSQCYSYSFLVSFYAGRKWVRMKFQTWYCETSSTKGHWPML